MRIRDLIEHGRPLYSFELFPPKTEEAEEKLWAVIRDELAPMKPTFVSVTYGAGGSTRDRTLRLVERIARETDLVPMAHLTTVQATRAELTAILDRLAEAGVSNVLALRGDPPLGSTSEAPAFTGELLHAIDLVELVHAHAPGAFSVGVAGFPEKHPQALDLESDARHLVEKVAAGADFVITQFFFEARHYFALVERAWRLGLPKSVPIVPGIMPVTNMKQIQRFAELSGAAFPGWLADRLRAVEDDSAAVRAVGVEVATDLCRELLDQGAPGLHFYTLNRSTATHDIYRNLGLPSGEGDG